MRLLDWYKIRDNRILFEAHVLDPQLPYIPILISYSSPRRCVTKDRQPALPCLGILLCYYNNNMEMIYTWGFDSDRKLTYNEILQIDRYLQKHYGFNITFVLKTAKGVHIYTNIESRRPHHVLRIAYNVSKKFHLDYHQVKLAKIRHQLSRKQEMAEFWGVLRLYGKYPYRDIYLYDIIHKECLNEWHVNVLGLLGYVLRSW